MPYYCTSNSSICASFEYVHQMVNLSFVFDYVSRCNLWRKHGTAKSFIFLSAKCIDSTLIKMVCLVFLFLKGDTPLPKNKNIHIENNVTKTLY